MAFLIFFSIVLLIYTSVNYYIFVRGMQALPAGSLIKTLFPWVFWGLAATYIIGRTLEKIYLSQASDFFVWTGSFWLAAMLYFFLAVVLLDLVRLIQHFIPLLPSFVMDHYEKAKLWVFSGTVLSVIVLIVAGHINTLYPRVNKIDIHIAKQASGMQQLNAVMLSDIHLGTIIGNGHFSRIVDQVQSLQPDIILLAGDILDEDLEPVLRQNIGETLRRLHAPLGVYGVMGNHEYIGGAEPAYEYLKSHGLTMLRDSVVKINNGFYIAGREDRDKSRFAGRTRKPLEQLAQQTDTSFPVILIDHQPYYLEEAAELGFDLQLSGHTHHGQLWPLNLVTSAIFTLSRGYKKIGSMHAVVSNGVGTWGPPVRIGNRPEIIQLNITFEP